MNDPAALPEWSRHLTVFDLETTGVNTREARIVTACIARLDQDGHVTAASTWLADPGIDIPVQAQRVHGISTDKARREGRPAADVVAEVRAVVEDSLRNNIAVVAYNAPYDFGVLMAECRRHGIPPIGDPAPVIDPLVLDRHLDTYRKGKRTLSAATEVYGVTLDHAHTAEADAVAAGQVALAIARRYADQLTMTAMDLHLAQQDWARAQEESFARYMERVGRPYHARYGWPLSR
ncbi:MAG TPA: 3'-5' exonuclease [Pseudoclavibacter sp.]|nr:3'-5' exonuclease [Pseudoclavibacter sp.]